MIFVTVGMQMPFPRLVTAIDQWAARNHRVELFAQIGNDRYPPAHLKGVAFLSPTAFRKTVQSAQLVVSHGGTGTILTAMEFGIPLLVMPRKKDLRETRCDHQFSTCSYFARTGAVELAHDEDELLKKLDLRDRIKPPRKIGPFASDLLLQSLSEFINGVKR